MRKIGCHVSIAGGLENAPQRAAALGCEVFQIFSRSPRGGAAPRITSETAKQFQIGMKEYGQKACYIHTPYYINFASAEEKNRNNSIRIVREELERASLLGAKYVMTHLGSAEGEEAIVRSAQCVRGIMKGYRGSAGLLLEISAGAGNVVGDTFEELAAIMEVSNAAGICLDSCHAFASGYDFRTDEDMDQLLKKIRNTVGKSAIKLIHANDSKVGLGERRDRHEHIGAGKIGRVGFEQLMRAFNVDFILETEHDKIKADIQVLKKIRKTL
jgi:deoxyribonuclease-4